ncbi:hypothetical protein [Nocardia wallacei]|nr:hypothetical protein [Nocardia wallacei]
MAAILDLVMREFARTSSSWLVPSLLVNDPEGRKQIRAKAWLGAELPT